LPIISGEVLLGIMMLKHSRPCHFSQEIVALMRINATQEDDITMLTLQRK
jgi:GAF domain-containing protein